MIKWIKSIDSLLVFMLLCLLTLFSFVGDYTYFLPKSNQGGFKYYVDNQSVFDVMSTKNSVYLNNYNSNFDLFYSVDGGKSYRLYSGQNLVDIKMNDLTKVGTSIRYKHPFGELPQVSSFLVKSKHKNKSFYSHPKQISVIKNYQSKLPLVNLVVNKDDLIDNYKGILLLGSKSWEDKGFYKESWYRSANYNQRGDKWLKKVYFQYFDNDSLQYETIANIQISGHASRSFSQKSMKIKSSNLFGDSKLNYPFFGEEGLKKYSAVVLRNSGNDNRKTLFADLLMHRLIKNTHVLSQKGKVTNVFLNGNYWGIYNLRERHNSYYIAKKENVKSNEVTVLEKGNGRLKSGNKKEQEQYVKFIDSLKTLEGKTDEIYSLAKQTISLKSFIDYILIEAFYGNGDWLTNNTLWYKAKQKKWKWLIVDLDYGLAYTGKENLHNNYFNKIKNSNTITAELFNLLLTSPKFKMKLNERSKELMQNIFSDKVVKFEYFKLKHTLDDEIHYQLNRWRGNFSLEEWEKNCSNNLEFLLNRKSIFTRQVEQL